MSFIFSPAGAGPKDPAARVSKKQRKKYQVHNNPVLLIIMNLPFTLIVLFVGSVSAAGPAWSPACETKNSGLYTPQNQMLADKTFQKQLVSDCGQRPPGCALTNLIGEMILWKCVCEYGALTCDASKYTECYNRHVYTACPTIKYENNTEAESCIFETNGTSSFLAVCYPAECTNEKDLAASASWLSNLERYTTKNTVTCGSIMSAGGVFGMVVLVIAVIGAAGGGIWWWYKKKNGNGYVSHN